MIILFICLKTKSIAQQFFSLFNDLQKLKKKLSSDVGICKIINIPALNTSHTSSDEFVSCRRTGALIRMSSLNGRNTPKCLLCASNLPSAPQERFIIIRGFASAATLNLFSVGTASAFNGGSARDVIGSDCLTLLLEGGVAV